MEELGGEKAVERLTEKLTDKRGPVRRAAARALGRQSDARAVEPLIGLLGDENQSVRDEVLRSLVKLNDQRAIIPIAGLLPDAAAERALRRFGYQQVREALMARGDPPQVDHVELLKIFGPLPPKLRPRLGTDGDASFNIEYSGDKDLKDRVDEALKDALGSDVFRWAHWQPPTDVRIVLSVRAEALRASYRLASGFGMFSEIRYEEVPAGARFRAELSVIDRGHRVFSFATEALRKPPRSVTTRDQTVEQVLEGLKTPVGEVIGDSGLPGILAGLRYVIPPVSARIAVLTNRDAYAADPGVRETQAQVLGEIGSPQAIEALTAVLKDKQDKVSVRQAAAQALGAIGDARAVEPLIAVLKNAREEGSVRGEAAEALGTIGDARAVEPLVSCLRDLELIQLRPVARSRALIEVRTESLSDTAARALGTIGDTRAVQPLIAALMQEHDSVALALGAIGDMRAVEPLIALLGNTQQRTIVRHAAAQALGTIGDTRAVERLIARLKDEESHLRSGAAEALAAIGDTRAVEPLIVAFTNPQEEQKVRRVAAQALGRIGESRAVEPLAEAVKKAEAGANVQVTEGAVQALGRIGDRRYVELLIAVLNNTREHSSVRCEAARALGRIGDARAVEPLLAALKDPDGWVRSEVARVLSTLRHARTQSLEPRLTSGNQPSSRVLRLALNAFYGRE